MKKSLYPVFFIVLAISFMACSGGSTPPSQKNPLIGKWQCIDKNDDVVFEFFADNTLKAGNNKGTYQIIDDKSFKAFLPPVGLFFYYTITGDTLYLSTSAKAGEGGGHYKRIK
jgi:hypothetical protein